MRDGPQVTVSGAGGPDVLGDDEEAERRPRRPARLLALALAAAVGFGAGQVVDALSVEAGAPALALVTGREPYLDASGVDEPSTSVEVALVNTGPDAVVLDGAEVDGSGLAWEADRPLEPGQQVTAVLREQQPCEGAPDRLSGRAGTPRLRVRLQDPGGAELPALSLVLPGGVGRRYDDHVRAVCALPRLPDALDLVQARQSRDGDVAVVDVGLLNRSVRPLRVTELSSPVPGLRAVLTDVSGRAVPVPLDLPGRSRSEIAQGYAAGDPSSTPYRLRLSAGPDACVPVGPSGSGGAATVVYVDPDEPGQLAERPVFADLAGVVRGSCS